MGDLSIREISDRLDLQLIKAGGKIVKDEYEKSLYMTKASNVYYSSLLSVFGSNPEVFSKLERVIDTVTIDYTEVEGDPPYDLVNPYDTDEYGGLVVKFDKAYRQVLRDRVILKSDNLLYSGLEVKTEEERLSEIEDSLKNPFRKAGEYYVTKISHKALSVTTTGATPVTYTIKSLVLYTKDSTITVGKYIATVAVPLTPFILINLASTELDINGVSDVIPKMQFKPSSILEIIDIAVALMMEDLGLGGAQVQQPQPQQQQQQQSK